MQCTLVAGHISLTSCNIISSRSLYIHPLLISYLFGDITYHLDLVLSAYQPNGSCTPCLSAFVNPSHFLLLNAMLNFRDPRMGSLNSLCSTSCWFSIEIMALNCLVFFKENGVLCTDFGDRHTDRQTDRQADGQYQCVKPPSLSPTTAK